MDNRGRIKLTEAQVSEQVKDFLEAEGWRVHPLHAENNFRHRKDRREQTGCPDYVCVHPCDGWFYLEMKRPGGKLRPAQVAYQLEALRDGCTHVVADNFESFQTWYRRCIA